MLLIVINFYFCKANFCHPKIADTYPVTALPTGSRAGSQQVPSWTITPWLHRFSSSDSHHFSSDIWWILICHLHYSLHPLCVCVRERERREREAQPVWDTGWGQGLGRGTENTLIFWIHNTIMTINMSAMQYLKKPGNRVVIQGRRPHLEPPGRR